MKIPAISLLLLAAGLAPGLAQATTAKTVHPTELHAESQSDSETLSTLPEGSTVEVLQQRGAWTQVKASGQTGWVRMLNLRNDAAGGANGSANAGNALASLGTLGRKSNSGTETNGVRGINEEDIRNAQPNPAAFEKMQSLASDKSTAQRFGRNARLNATQVSYLPDSNNSR